MNNWSSDCFCIMKRDFERSSPWIECDALRHIFFCCLLRAMGRYLIHLNIIITEKGTF